MKVYKTKIDKTEQGKKHRLHCNYGEGYAVTVQAVYYSSINPNSYLHLFDGDGDEFMFKVPGQGGEGTEDVNPTTPEIAVTVKLPLYVVDSSGGNTVKVWGEVHKIDTKVETPF